MQWSGPVSTLPGAASNPEGEMCDEHPERPAVVRIQGETDSFGAEYHNCCEECRDEMRDQSAQDRPGSCDWCKQDAPHLRPKRDFEEGMHGPVYYVCQPCAERYDKRMLEDWEDDDDWDECW